VPLLPLIPGSCSSIVMAAAGVVRVDWLVTGQGLLRVIANLSDQAAGAPPTESGTLLWQEGQQGPDGLSPWFVRWSFHPQNGLQPLSLTGQRLQQQLYRTRIKRGLTGADRSPCDAATSVPA
jgi:hypothetical protein